jgi:CelD/BcsL family acetyltransferase involved in cellulose biosynthesis
MAPRRFSDPLLLEAFEGSDLVGLALFNRRDGRLYLSEAGEPVLDNLTVEHNGVLAARDRAPEVRLACMSAARRASRRVTLSGVGEADQRAAAATGPAHVSRTSPSPYVDLAALRASGKSYLASLGANTRYQINRSIRRYAEAGPLAAARAEGLAQAESFLAALIELHAARWSEKSRPGAFAESPVLDFHRELLVRGVPRGEIGLWRVTAGDLGVGYLYNFEYNKTVMAYQSGFTAPQTPQGKPGLVCHSLVIQTHLGGDAAAYDFLGGDHRYKLNLSAQARQLYWTDLTRRGSPRWAVYKVREFASSFKFFDASRSSLQAD